jgi:hypothetical protein
MTLHQIALKTKTGAAKYMALRNHGFKPAGSLTDNTEVSAVMSLKMSPLACQTQMAE